MLLLSQMSKCCSREVAPGWCLLTVTHRCSQPAWTSADGSGCQCSCLSPTLGAVPGKQQGIIVLKRSKYKMKCVDQDLSFLFFFLFAYAGCVGVLK